MEADKCINFRHAIDGLGIFWSVFLRLGQPHHLRNMNMKMNATNRIAASLLAACIGVILTTPLEAFAADVVKGQALYMANCSSCHGQYGISDMKEAPNLASFDMAEKSDEELMDTIQSGSGSMPPYVGVFNDDELDDLMSFLRTLH